MSANRLHLETSAGDFPAGVDAAGKDGAPSIGVLPIRPIARSFGIVTTGGKRPEPFKAERRSTKAGEPFHVRCSVFLQPFQNTTFA